MVELQITLFGSFEMQMDGHVQTNFPTRKTKALLAYLAVEQSQPHRRTTLANLLWPDQPEARARQSLRQTLFYLRRIVPKKFFITTKDTVQLVLENKSTVDVNLFKQHLQASQIHQHEPKEVCLSCLSRLKQAAQLYRADFLNHLFLEDSHTFEEWSVLYREHLRRQASELFSLLVDLSITATDYDQAYTYAKQYLQLNQLHEGAYQQLMKVLHLSGRRSEALQQFERCKRLLAQELGVEPTQITQNLAQAIRESTVSPTPPPKTPRSHPTIPRATTSLIGRVEEIEQITTYLDNPDCRLLTLTGPAGIGKTRLSLQIAHQIQSNQQWETVRYIPLAKILTAQEFNSFLTEFISQPESTHFSARPPPLPQNTIN